MNQVNPRAGQDIEGAERERLQKLLPLYVTGELSSRDQAEVEAWLDTDPKAATQLDIARRRMAERGVSGLSLSRQPFWSRLGLRIANLPSRYAWGIAAIAIFLAVLQTIRLPNTTDATDDAAAQQPVLPSVLVSFSEAATIGEVNETLRDLGLEIVAGPLPEAAYKVNIPARTEVEYEKIVADLQTASPVEWVVAGEPPTDD